jgi:hypothetical protein
LRARAPALADVFPPRRTAAWRSGERGNDCVSGVHLNRPPRRWAMTAVCAKRTTGVDVKRTYANCASRPIQLASIGRARDMADADRICAAGACSRAGISLGRSRVASGACRRELPGRALGRGCGGRGAAGSALARVRGGGARGRSRPRALHLDFASQSQARSTQNSQENMVFVVNNTWQKRCC